MIYLYLSTLESGPNAKPKHFLDENDLPKSIYHALTREVVELYLDGIHIPLTTDLNMNLIKRHRVNA